MAGRASSRHQTCSQLPHRPMRLNAPSPVEFELENFKGRCMFLHRPAFRYENPDSDEAYPYKLHFHGRKRLWEYRLQGQFKRKPGTLFMAVELEEYVPVNFATRLMMRGILPLIQTALQCKLVHHEVGRPDDASLRPSVACPIWAIDNTVINDDPAEAPDLASSTLPLGLDRKAARQYWEDVWNGSHAWDEQTGGPTFTFAMWGPSPLLDLRHWVFRKLPLMLGRELAMEPFSGRQPIHATVYEIQGNDRYDDHRQEDKIYVSDIRMMPEDLWLSRSTRCASSSSNGRPVGTAKGCVDELRTTVGATAGDSPTGTFCSALSHSGSDEQLFAVDAAVDSADDTLLPGSPKSPKVIKVLPRPRGKSADISPKQTGSFFCRCYRRRRAKTKPRWDLLPV